MRAQLDDLGLVAFVANGSVLPRLAGNCDPPMKEAVTLSPKNLSKSPSQRLTKVHWLVWVFHKGLP